jgi:hypothetical protein
MYIIGFGLILLGIVLFLIGRRPSRRSTVSADRGSIAIGGSAYGPVTNLNAATDKEDGASGGHRITLLAIIVEIAGIAVTIWHALHLAAR